MMKEGFLYSDAPKNRGFYQDFKNFLRTKVKTLDPLLMETYFTRLNYSMSILMRQ